uniref:Ras-related protein Rab n=1 Tax=Neobodo designis TaxID=312471 RepID=A0A7S1PP35_NEODS|mmetsp:Transcript_14479/g.44918  ORF Transcript_14479/g.44918 Transcript_14479/m.44918 type:complete len:221 (+) Transcript_14479:64-726(+)
MAASSSQDKMYKVLMVGRAAVGKTCILRRYCLEYFSDQVVPTLGCDFVLKTLQNYEGQGDVKLQIWDIAGQDYAPHVSHVFFRGAFAAVVACDITSERSYEVAAQWKRDIDAKVFFPGTPKNIPCVIMLNKCDMGGSHMSDEQLDAFCAEHKFIGWFAVSAKTGENLDTAFEALLKKIRQMDEDRQKATGPQPVKATGAQPVDVSRKPTEKPAEEKKCPC